MENVNTRQNPSDIERLGREIARRRKSLLISQNILAQNTGLSQNFISLIESGKRNINVRTLLRILSVLGAELNLSFNDSELEKIVEEIESNFLPTSDVDYSGRTIAKVRTGELQKYKYVKELKKQAWDKLNIKDEKAEQLAAITEQCTKAILENDQSE